MHFHLIACCSDQIMVISVLINQLMVVSIRSHVYCQLITIELITLIGWQPKVAL